MQKNFILVVASFFLALIASPAQAGTHSSGDSCVAAQVGATEMSADQTGIIGCFKTAAGSTSYIWKNTSGGGIGQCYSARANFSDGPVTLYPTGGFSTSPSVSDVVGAGFYATTSSDFTSIFGSTAGTPFGISGTGAAGVYCKTGYTRTGCSGYGSQTVTVGADASIPAYEADRFYIGKMGCYMAGAPGPSTGTWETTYNGYMDIVCCKSE